MFLSGSVWFHILRVTDVFTGKCFITYTNSNWCFYKGTVWLHIQTVTDVFIGECLITYTNSNWCFYRGLFDYIY